MDLKFENFNIPMVNKRWIESSCLFVSVSGSHSFGWATKDSDLDLRFVVCQNLAQLISPFYPFRTKARTDTNFSDGKPIDITEYEIGHYLHLLAKGNGNAIDNLFEPKLAEQKQQVQRLQQIVSENIHKGFIAHCLGYSKHIRKDFDVASRTDHYGIQKLLLCRYRTLLQGYHLLGGHIEHNLPKLLNCYSTQNGQAILTSYLNGYPINWNIVSDAINETDKLHQQLSDNLDKSDLPDSHDSLIEVRLDRWMRNYYLGETKKGVTTPCVDSLTVSGE
jgi:predicted nucleotidyltransferase